MKNAKQPPTLADYITLAISPVFIMLLVGSLVFFLIDVLYSGPYIERLRWTMFWFVLGVVLISRMTMDAGTAGRAGAYGVILGAVVLMALKQFVTYDDKSPFADYGWLVNMGLMAVAWWSAHRLTWDCTFIDEQGEASGVGLLQSLGWEQRTEAESVPKRVAPQEPEPKKKKKKNRITDATELPGMVGWLERYRKFAEENRRKGHTPGVWVVYFSLAALPLFGIGQSFIAADDVERRQHAFWMMILYVASGLTLLVTTCFVGIRRYLRHKDLAMPPSMAAVWLSTGAVLIVLFMLLGALLPRPHPEYPLVNMSTLLGSTEQDASKYAASGNKPGKGKGRESDEKQEKGDEGKATEGNNPKGGDPEGKQGKGKDESEKDKGKGGDGSSKNEKGKQGELSKGQDKPKSEVEEYLEECARPMKTFTENMKDFWFIRLMRTFSARSIGADALGARHSV